ncbi:MAG: hypothetical protein LBH84_05425 [Prevotellaceae bacterium]|nr:hypothetical protein [Prevotellaceae bacterium]
MRFPTPRAPRYRMTGEGWRIVACHRQLRVEIPPLRYGTATTLKGLNVRGQLFGGVHPPKQLLPDI